MDEISITTWNWQQPSWPSFTWDREKLVRAEILFAEQVGVVIAPVFALP